MTIAEGQAVVETARRYGRVYQTGTQRLSEANFVFAIEMARTGRLGKVHTAYAHIAPWDAAEMRHDWLPAEPEPPKDEVDWDAWLGPCPWRPYNPAYVARRLARPLRFPHQLHRRMGRAHVRPGPGRPRLRRHLAGRVRVRRQRQRRRHGHALRQRREDDPLARRQVLARLVRRCGSTAPRAGSPPPTATPSPTSPRRPCWPTSRRSSATTWPARGRPMNHVRELLRLRQVAASPTVANPAVMHRSMTTVHAANICMWLKRDLKFDPVKEEFVNDAEANRLRSRAMRAPWTI